MKYLFLFLAVGLFSSSVAQRYVISLNGIWDVEESIDPNDIPRVFTHSGPVPGLANLCKPAFQNVDAFDGIDYLNNSWVKNNIKNIPTDTIKTGISRQDRNYFWYRTTFKLPEKRELIILKINKAQFGTGVWVNGKWAGEHLGCFTAGFFDISPLGKKFRYQYAPGQDRSPSGSCIPIGFPREAITKNRNGPPVFMTMYR
jgi:beta-galactosidase